MTKPAHRDTFTSAPELSKSACDDWRDQHEFHLAIATVFNGRFQIGVRLTLLVLGVETVFGGLAKLGPKAVTRPLDNRVNLTSTHSTTGYSYMSLSKYRFARPSGQATFWDSKQNRIGQCIICPVINLKVTPIAAFREQNREEMLRGCSTQ